MFSVIWNAFQEVLGETGTWLVPNYSYSFCKRKPFNIQETKSDVGYFTELFRHQPGVIRSSDPILSVTGIGPYTIELFNDLSNECYGKGSLYERLVKYNAFICNVGVGFRYATFIHHVECMIGVPYRFNMTFEGEIIDHDTRRYRKMIYYARKSLDDPSAFPDLRQLEKDALAASVLNIAPIGRGRVTRISCKDIYALCERGIKKNPYYLAKGKYGSKNVEINK